jgi:PemK-like, MazF-like toxin of type II toxin-antitoxin system
MKPIFLKKSNSMPNLARWLSRPLVVDVAAGRLRQRGCGLAATTCCSMNRQRRSRSRGVEVAAASQEIGRGHVYLVRLDPTIGGEIKKTRPCVVVSPDELNEHLRTVIVAP